MTHLFDPKEERKFLKAEDKVLCGQNPRRSAITTERFVDLREQGKIRKDSICKACLRRFRG